MKPIPLSIRTLYDDLVQQILGRIERPGSPYTRELNGVEYVYVKEAVGSMRRDVFLGRTDSPEVRARVEAIRAEAERAKEQRKIVSTLRRAGIPTPTRALGFVLHAVSDAGLFRTAVLVGTGAYQCYAPMVGVALPSSALATQDADLAITSLALSAGGEGDTMEAILQRADASFRPVPGLDPKALPSRFRSAEGFFVDLLTPELRRDDSNPMPLEGLAAGAVPMHYLAWLIEGAVEAVALHGSGVAIRVPLPARYAIHKLVVAQKRKTDRGKRQKDLVQAKALIDALGVSDPWALSDAFEDACKQGGKGWEQPIERSLSELGIAPETLREGA